MIDVGWAICKFRFHGPFLFLRYSDSSGAEPSNLLLDPNHLNFEGLATRLWKLMTRPAGSEPWNPVPIAVYYSFPKGIELPAIMAGFIASVGDLTKYGPIQVVRLNPAKTVRRSPLVLPLSILCTPETRHLLESFDYRLGLSSDVVSKFGVRIEVLRGDLELTLRTGNYSIILTEVLGNNAPMLERLPERARPRLIIVAGWLPDSMGELPGIAVLELGEPHPVFLTEFLFNIVHDLPLHHALHSASQSGETANLVADPLTNQSLRLTAVLAGLKRHADRHQAYYGGSEKFRNFQDEFRSIQQNRAASVLAIRKLNALNFDHETNGLLPMAETADALEYLARNKPSLPPVRGEATRRLDASLTRIQTAPALKPVEPTESLEADSVYELRVHIGNRFPESLVAGDVSAIDELVGPPDDESGGHQLDISVQGKDFRVVSVPSKQLHLPRAGSTDLVYFQVRTPKTLGKARLRITVHHRNHLIQSFVLAANIAESERVPGTLEIRQEFARSEQFKNLDQLRERSLFIGMNHGQTTHEIMIKADQATSELDLSVKAYDQCVKDLRQALSDAVLIPNLQLARTYPKIPPGGAPGPDAADAFRRLAKLGRAVYDALFSSLPRGGTRKAMVRLQNSANEKIQVVRFETRSAFPWTLLYDWQLPDDIFGAPPSPVCLGSTITAGQTASCTHGAKDKVFCVRGFWGVRHLVEELLEQQRNASQTVTKPTSDVIRVIASTVLPQGQTLQTNLNTTCGAGVLASGPAQEYKLLDLLWQDPPVRPAVLIVLGHLETTQIAGQPDTPRVELQPSSEWLTLKHLLDRATQAADQWDDPRTIVIFAPCEGAAIDEDTLNSFVTALNTAGAGAIIGMQSVVGGDQAAEFAEKLTLSLWTSNSLGEAMQKVRSETIRSGDPAGFLLQSFGDVDLKLQ
jgi:hypothetical protein